MENGKIRFEKRVTQNNQERFIVIHVWQCKAYCLTQALRIGLHYRAGLAPGRTLFQKRVYSFGLITRNKNRFRGLKATGRTIFIKSNSSKTKLYTRNIAFYI